MPNEEKQKKKNIGNIMLNVFIGLILAIVLFITVNIIISSVSGKGYNSIFGMAFLAVESESMSTDSGYEPKEGEYAGFEIGDLIFVQEKNDSMEFKVGDIITFHDRQNGVDILNTHRITHILNMGDNTFFVTKGDYNPVVDSDMPGGRGGDVSLKDVIGKYTGAKIGWIGHIGIFLATPLGYWLIIGVPAFLILLYCIISFVLTVTKRNKAEIADEKERIRAQILEELRAQGLSAPAEVLPDAADTAGDAAAEEQTPPESGMEAESDINKSIDEARAEIMANSGLSDAPAAKQKPAAVKKPATASKTAAKKPAAKKPAAKKTASGKGGLIGTSAKKPTAKKSTDTTKTVK